MSAIGAISKYQNTPGAGGAVGTLSGGVQAAGKAPSVPRKTDVVTISQEARNAAQANGAQVDTTASALATSGQRAMTSGASASQMQQYAAAMSAYY